MSADRPSKPRVYVACLHCYNAGRLHGEWFDVGTDPGDLYSEVLSHFGAGCACCGTFNSECLACRASTSRLPCGGEELAVHDHEGLGQLGETFDLEHLCAVAMLLELFPDRPALAYLKHVDGHVERACEGLRERYAGSWDSTAEWAESWAEVWGAGITTLWPYVDWERYARDLELGGGITTIRDGAAVHVFGS